MYSIYAFLSVGIDRTTTTKTCLSLKKRKSAGVGCRAAEGRPGPGQLGGCGGLGPRRDAPSGERRRGAAAEARGAPGCGRAELARFSTSSSIGIGGKNNKNKIKTIIKVLRDFIPLKKKKKKRIIFSPFASFSSPSEREIKGESRSCIFVFSLLEGN